MNDLDQKLKLILEELINHYNDTEPLRVGELTFVEQIKQVFADAGYMPWKDVADTGIEILKDVKEKHNLMTGQEWFNRFDEAIREYEGRYWIGQLPNEVFVAAKKAAGISDEG